jgi:hypothetical protein
MPLPTLISTTCYVMFGLNIQCFMGAHIWCLLFYTNKDLIMFVAIQLISFVQIHVHASSWVNPNRSYLNPA